jgi:hypothetical protein
MIFLSFKVDPIEGLPNLVASRLAVSLSLTHSLSIRNLRERVGSFQLIYDEDRAKTRAGVT